MAFNYSLFYSSATNCISSFRLPRVPVIPYSDCLVTLVGASSSEVFCDTDLELKFLSVPEELLHPDLLPDFYLEHEPPFRPFPLPDELFAVLAAVF